MEIKPILNNILFTFRDEIKNNNGKRVLSQETDWGFEITQNIDSMLQNPQIGIIRYLGEDAKKEGLEVGMKILIENMMWTEEFNVDGEQLWKTDASKVIGIVDE